MILKFFYMKKILIFSAISLLLITVLVSWIPEGAARKDAWQVGIGRRVMTPQNDVWLAGYGTKRENKNKIHDIWVKVMALKDPSGKRVVMATTDHMGMSRSVYETSIQKSISSSGSTGQIS